MFSADLSWSTPNTETVGQRRERKAQERSSTSGSIRTVSSSRSSIVVDRDLWWTSGLKKAKGIRFTILQPSSHHSSNSQRTVHSETNSLELLPEDLKDPTQQPPWTYASTLSPTLPSGASFDLPVHEVPELEGDLSSRRTNSTEARFSRKRIAQERRWEVGTPGRADIIEEASQQWHSAASCGEKRSRLGSVSTDIESYAATRSPRVPVHRERRPCTAIVDAAPNLDALRIHDTEEEFPMTGDIRLPLNDQARPSARTIDCPPLSQWASLTPREVPSKIHLAPKPVINNFATAHSSTLEQTRFQLFIRRMESAGPKIVLDRLKEDWQDSPGEEWDEQLALEKQLWLLTGFQMQNAKKVRATPKPACDTGRILELYGNLSEVFQMSAMHPHHSVHFLTNKTQRPVTLPANVSHLTVRDCGVVPLPYPECYFSHIRASTLPSLVPSSNLPELFRECYKLLAPGGLIDIRILDPAPVRKTAGPLLRAWIDDRLSLSLERLFRCSKPCSLVPSWLENAGFEMTDPDGITNVTLPCAFDSLSADVDKELSVVIGRALWKDLWGSFVDEVPGEPKWWWEDEDIIRECLEHQTVLECRAIFAFKAE
ncbi:hypothetical protein BDU57DRAFT_595683 [Ampelomyces quisqualis]|uniref:Methyltransferase type 11 domain-containing protein n=1 Tax=Ampelomyces quisqualis TaxID=50730 RepID=A0A6A5QI42_AMPQU|nr:hypothetical protein BDU57DRAFT_595683 [Ampelomyces quisqualis]